MGEYRDRWMMDGVVDEGWRDGWMKDEMEMKEGGKGG